MQILKHFLFNYYGVLLAVIITILFTWFHFYSGNDGSYDEALSLLERSDSLSASYHEMEREIIDTKHRIKSLESPKEYSDIDLKLHEPSLIVLLDQNANYFDLDIDLGYEDGIEKNDQNEGMVDVNVYGSYTDIRDYIEFLERAKLLEPTDINVYVDQENGVGANLLLVVYHT